MACWEALAADFDLSREAIWSTMKLTNWYACSVFVCSARKNSASVIFLVRFCNELIEPDEVALLVVVS